MITKINKKTLYKKKKRFKNFVIKPEQALHQKRVFKFSKFGYLKFFFVISHYKTNTFFSFFCKASKIPSKVFLFCKYSTGSESRDAIRKKQIPAISLRGRGKNQLQRIRFKYNQLKAYLYEFIRLHPEIKNCISFNLVWKIYKLDMNIHTLIEIPFIIYLKTILTDKLQTKKVLPITQHFILKFPHNGCRPKKIRRLKRKRR